MKHGTRYMYQKGKCRCDLCRQANADYQRDYMFNRYVPATQIHGGGFLRNDGTLRITGHRVGAMIARNR